jgi:hypothetical protein
MKLLHLTFTSSPSELRFAIAGRGIGGGGRDTDAGGYGCACACAAVVELDVPEAGGGFSTQCTTRRALLWIVGTATDLGLRMDD